MRGVSQGYIKTKHMHHLAGRGCSLLPHRDKGGGHVSRVCQNARLAQLKAQALKKVTSTAERDDEATELSTRPCIQRCIQEGSKRRGGIE